MGMYVHNIMSVHVFVCVCMCMCAPLCTTLCYVYVLLVCTDVLQNAQPLDAGEQ